MALYTDGPPSSIEDLSAQDSQLLDVANTEGIDLTKKLALAHEQGGIMVQGLLSRFVSAPDIGHVVVTPPLRLWHTYRALELVYNDAYYNQTNDRYARKRDRFTQEARWAYESLVDAGLGMTANPVPRAATPELATMAGTLPDGTYYATMAWTNTAGEEGAAATAAAISISGNTLLLHPGRPPAGVTGWNAYVGTAPESLSRQNAQPIAADQTWLQAGPVISGSAPGDGQAAAYFYPVPRVIQRG